MALKAWSDPSSREFAEAEVRAALDLTDSYVATDHVALTPFDLLAILLDYTHADATSVEWYIEWSFNGTDWFRMVNINGSSGVNTIYQNYQTFASVTAALCMGGIPVEAPFARLKVKKTGGVGSNPLAATLGAMRKF